ncbi:MAG: valine--tRNA ligase [Planctomycetes bacterium]|nr:valine--tRNA ligase [Planctomycetota bacterium]
MTAEMEKTYQPAAVEKARYRFWMEGGWFAAQPTARGARRPYVIVIPPPNVTGALHMGHALDNSIQDFLIRYRRMRGDDALWVPGTDHAGIATQPAVEKQLLAETGKRRDEIGREALVAAIWKWKETYGERILGQLANLGCSCDWSRARFTLDERCSRAVRRTFFDFFKKGLIYRGKRLVNWDPATRSALADDEVEHETVKGAFYHVRYPVKNSPEHVVVATTRPETMLGDTAVAVNPRDERYRSLHGQTVVLPLLGREIPIIVDDYADPAKGSGCVKITPAHDPNDYQVGLRHGLPMINVLNPDGAINAAGGPYAGLDRFEARRRVVEDLKARGLLVKVEEIEHDVGHSYRSHVPVEPWLSDQWFVKVGPLAAPALEALFGGRLRFIPERYGKTYSHWLANLRDWCISRQLWWGHRIPVWFHRGRDDGALRRAFHGRDDVVWRADEENPGQWLLCALADIEPQLEQDLGLARDPDVLDTWFSSALWPHSVFGWPEATPDLARYYPTSTLVTGRDIITLWVSRMVMTGIHNCGAPPFSDVFIHAILHDGAGHRMSKSKGNGIDPQEIIDSYGADALRYVVAEMTTGSQDVRLPVFADCPNCEDSKDLTEYSERQADLLKTVITCARCRTKYKVSESAAGDLPVARRITSKRFEVGRNFCNKLWNSARFILASLDETDRWTPAPGERSPFVEDRWISSRLHATVAQVTAAFEAYTFADAATALYHFHWDDLCDWFLEIAKPRVRAGEIASRRWARWTLARVLDAELRLLHPIVPFITEEIWQRLRAIAPGAAAWPEALVVAEWPDPDATPRDEEAQERIALLQEVVRAVRNIRNKHKAPPGATVAAPVVNVREARHAAWLQDGAAMIADLARTAGVTVGRDLQKPSMAATEATPNATVFLSLKGLIDVAAERARIEKQMEKKEAYRRGIASKLANAEFKSRAPAALVAAEEERLFAAEAEIATLRAALADLAALGDGDREG